jgi:hypothetical protein
MLALLRSFDRLLQGASSSIQTDPFKRGSVASSPTLLLLLVQLSLFQAHLMRRLYESLTIANFSSRSQQHALVTLLGQ